MSFLLSWLVFLPMAAVPIILFLPSRAHKAIRWTSILFTAIQMALVVYLLAAYNSGTADYQFVERYNWIPVFNIQYYLGIDGLSVLMVILTPLVFFFGIFASWNISKGVKGYFMLYQVLNTGLMGVFCALDFFMFYVFWEVTLLPMYFLIGIWGGPRREYAAIKFFLYTLFGSVLMLLVMVALYFSATPHTFSIPELIKAGSSFKGTSWFLAFIGLYIAFAIKIPAFPFHTWLPDAHTEAPTAISVILAGVLLKMGVYGLIRISLPVLPEAAQSFSYIMALIGVINIIYGALCTMAQKDLKRMIAYSSISHMGFCLLGIAAICRIGVSSEGAIPALTGAVLQMFNHGCISAMLFLIAGVIYDRAHHRDINGFGGLASRMPLYAGMTALAFFASMGLPGLSGFVGEILVFMGAFSAYPIITVISVSGVVLAAGYFLWAMQRVFLGPLNEKYRDLPEVNAREMFTLVPFGIIILFLGVYPMPAINLISESVKNLIALVK